MFLRPEERQLMRRDGEELLNSAESIELDIHYKVPTNPVLNAAYDTWTADSWTDAIFTPKPKAIQKIIEPNRHYDIVRWGLLEAGDCIFYFSNNVNLKGTINGAMYDTATIVAAGVEWQPIPISRKEFYNYLLWRLGSSQVWQVIPCKLKGAG